MGILKKLVFFVIVILFTVSLSNCSKNNFSHNYQAKSRGSSPTIDPTSRKTTPVRKKYVVKGGKKRILGQEKPRI